MTYPFHRDPIIKKINEVISKSENKTPHSNCLISDFDNFTFGCVKPLQPNHRVFKQSDRI